VELAKEMERARIEEQLAIQNQIQSLREKKDNTS